MISISFAKIFLSNPTFLFFYSLRLITIGGARAFSNTSVTSAGKVTQVIGAVVDVQVRIKL